MLETFLYAILMVVSLFFLSNSSRENVPSVLNPQFWSWLTTSPMRSGSIWLPVDSSPCPSSLPTWLASSSENARSFSFLSARYFSSLTRITSSMAPVGSFAVSSAFSSSSGSPLSSFAGSAASSATGSATAPGSVVVLASTGASSVPGTVCSTSASFGSSAWGRKMT